MLEIIGNNLDQEDTYWKCLRAIYDLFEWANKKLGMLLLLGFEKAFDNLLFFLYVAVHYGYLLLVTCSLYSRGTEWDEAPFLGARVR